MAHPVWFINILIISQGELSSLQLPRDNLTCHGGAIKHATHFMNCPMKEIKLFDRWRSFLSDDVIQLMMVTITDHEQTTQLSPRCLRCGFMCNKIK